MKSRIKTIGITVGDPAGIGPEVTRKALSLIRLPKNVRLRVIGDKKSFLSGRPTKESARASLEYLQQAFSLIKKKEIDALVTGPVTKEGICSLGVNFTGHTEYIARYFAVKNYEMMFVAENVRVVIATRHIPLSSVPGAITPKRLFDATRLTEKTLQKYFRIKKPFLAICGINPHAGEGGTIGKEEKQTVIPALKRLKEQGLRIAGPLSADTLFYPTNAKKYDAIISMYHDQGLSPIKALYFDKLVNLTIGLPFIRTSPAHGTAFDIAGKNKADPSSMKAAIELAIRLS